MNKQLDKDWKAIITENSSTIAKLNKRLTEMEEREKQIIRNQVFTQNFIKQALPGKIIAMMAWPQLITALLGVLITFTILRIKHE